MAKPPATERKQRAPKPPKKKKKLPSTKNKIRSLERFLAKARICGAAMPSYAFWREHVLADSADSCVNSVFPLFQVTDPKTKKSLQQQLAALHKAREEHERSELERKMSKRYHKVKFFGEQPSPCTFARRGQRRLDAAYSHTSLHPPQSDERSRGRYRSCRRRRARCGDKLSRDVRSAPSRLRTASSFDTLLAFSGRSSPRRRRRRWSSFRRT